jgi:hypothetical protein
MIAAKNITGSVSSLRVSPLTSTGVRYALRSQAGRVQVAALLGSVRVNGANNLNVTLKAGEVYNLEANNTQPDPQGGNTGASNLNGSDMGLIFAISAAIIAGITVGLINAKEVSPAGP